MAKRKDSLDPYKPIHLRQTFESYGRERGQLVIPFGTCTQGDRIIVCDTHNHRIQIFNKDGRFISTFGSRGTEVGYFNYPASICTIEDNLYVADFHNSRIHIFDSTTYHPVGSISVGELNPNVICSTPEGLIAVATLQHSVLILNQEGKIVKSFGHKGAYKGQFNLPMGICCNHRGEIVIGDYINCRVQILSVDGKFLRGFGSIGCRPNQLSSPRGVCVDWEDNIYVADTDNSRVCIFNTEGVFIRQIPVDVPLALCLIERGIIVTSLNNFIQIFYN